MKKGGPSCKGSCLNNSSTASSFSIASKTYSFSKGGVEPLKLPPKLINLKYPEDFMPFRISPSLGSSISSYLSVLSLHFEPGPRSPACARAS